MILKISLIYIIISYIITVISIIFLIKEQRKTKVLTGNYKEDKGLIYMYSLVLGFSPITLPIIIVTMIINKIKGRW